MQWTNSHNPANAALSLPALWWAVAPVLEAMLPSGEVARYRVPSYVCGKCGPEHKYVGESEPRDSHQVGPAVWSEVEG